MPAGKAPTSKPVLLRGALITLLLAATSITAATHANAASCTEPRKASGSMSESIYRAVEEATKLISAQKHGDAIDKLTKLTESGNDYEKAIVFYNLGYAYASKNDHANAVKSFAQALSLNSMPQQQHEQLQYNLGQLYIVAGQHEDGIRTLQDYIAQACGTVPADAHIYLANALSGRKRYKDALPQIDLALSKAKAPKESWLQLKLAIYYELKDFKGCAQTLVQLISMVPAKADYWKQLSAMFMEMKSDTEALAVLALAERQGFIEKPNERKNLYSVYMMLDLPFKAGVLLQESIDKGKVPADEKNMEAVADAWLNARESARAETALKKLASSSGHGEHYYKLGAMYGDDERWKESIETLQKALNKGALKHSGEAWMRIAVAEYNLKNNSGAIAALQKAVTFDETRKQAGEWLRHLTSQTLASN